MRRLAPALAALSVFLVTTLPGCLESGGSEEGGGEDGLPSTAELEPDSAAERESGAGDGAPAPFPSLPGEGAPRTFGLRLVNLREVGAVVYASAGAERVVLDTVPALDSVVVNLRLRADWVELHAVGPDGEELAGGRLDLDPDSLSRWTIPGVSAMAPGARTAAASRPGSLVRARDPDYARASSGARAAAARAPARRGSPRE